MSAVTLHPSNQASSGRGARRSALGLALLGATLGFLGCDSSQYVQFILQNLPATGTVSVRVSYALDSTPDRVDIGRIVPLVDQFAISFPGDARGTMTAKVHAYTYVSPSLCYRSNSPAAIALNGSHKQELPIVMPAGTSGCDATQVPVQLPTTDTAPLAAWGSTLSNIWVVGEKGAILHWDGKTYTRIMLPSAFATTLPTWRTVIGSSSSPVVWVAGDRGAVGYWDGTQLQAVPLMPAMGSMSALPNWVATSISTESSTAAGEIVTFVSSDGYIGIKGVPQNTVVTFNQTDTYPAYPLNAPARPLSSSVSFSDIYCIAKNECWLVGTDPNSFGGTGAGIIFQQYVTDTGILIYSDYSMNPATPTQPLAPSRLRGIWGKFSGTAPMVRQLYVVGDNATALFSNNSTSATDNTDPNSYPRFQTDYSALAMNALQGQSLQLNAIGGTSTNDLWIVGNAGVFMRWAPTPALPDSPFTVYPIGVTANLTNVFSIGPENTVGLYISGDQQTFLSPWLAPLSAVSGDSK